ncbi:FAD-binding Berberine family protein [Forsythia ovata]|uniref:FAD-binding Berberine family protein n=1 Tax=Forsythia ovata TaxID=205694 RepID=A0ABD1S0X8_9LAMI
MDEIPESATPFPHRAGNIFKLQYFANWNEDDAASDKKYVEQTRTLYSYMTPFVSKNPREAFLNYRDLDIGTTDNGKNTYTEAMVYGVKFFKGNFARLVKVKTIIDPENFFRNEQSIPPLPSHGRKKPSAARRPILKIVTHHHQTQSPHLENNRAARSPPPVE